MKFERFSVKFERFSVIIRFFGDHHAILCMEQSRKSVKLDLWLKLKFGSWCHVFILFSSPGFWLINENKNGSLKANLPINISFLLSSQTHIFCRKCLAVKFGVKYIFTN